MSCIYFTALILGGVGTLDEIFDCVCGKSLGMKGMVYKPVCLVNVDGFYDGLVMQMDRSHEEGKTLDDIGLNNGGKGQMNCRRL